MPKPLVIVSTLPEAQNEALEKHPGISLIRHAGEPWRLPTRADALFTFQSQWKNAPADAPDGWPFGLKWLQVASAGVDTFPRWALSLPLVARERGIQAPAIAEYVIGAVFAHEKRFWDGSVRDQEAWSHKMLGGVAGKTIGIAGMGAIGEEVARLALAVGMRVAAVTRRSSVKLAGVEAVAELSSLFATSDHVALTLPLTPETRRCVGPACFAAVKPGLHLINVARGAIIDTPALLAALDSSRLSGATLDVTEVEPPSEGDPLYTHKKVRLTPHVSGMSEMTDRRMNEFLIANITAYLAGGEIVGKVETSQGY
ncbi:MAG TPA: NAD(P)-dependent oxidoreductase [Devosia sp.]|nr:NAD(P)-dependent oxidoreductase [Devosia sp.]